MNKEYNIEEEPEILTKWQDPTVEEYKKEIDRLNNIINEAIYYLEIDMPGTAIDKLKELKEGNKDG